MITFGLVRPGGVRGALVTVRMAQHYRAHRRTWCWPCLASSHEELLETHEASDVLSVPFPPALTVLSFGLTQLTTDGVLRCRLVLAWRPWLQCSWCASCDARIRSSIYADEESRVLAGAWFWRPS